MARQSRPHQNLVQKETVGRVMHEFKQGELQANGGRRVRNPKQAIAIALHQVGASRDESPAKNRRNLRRAKAGERQVGRQVERSRAELYAEAGRRNIVGRSRMTKAELARALR